MSLLPKSTPHFELQSRLKDIFGETRVSRSDLDRVAYARDLWPRLQLETRHGEVSNPPEFVVWPQSPTEVSQLLRLANDMHFPVIPYGAGSGVCGGTLPISGGVICDLKLLNRIIKLNHKAMTVTVQAGIIGEHLERELNRHGYTLGHFPSSIYCSTLGGYLAARSAGQLSTLYGKIEDMVVRLQAVLPDGTIMQTRRTPRSATGPDFDQVLVGSEGTLCVITWATLRIHLMPADRSFRAFTFDGLEKGVEAIRLMMRRGVKPAAVRLYDETDTALAMAAIEMEASGNLLILTFEGEPRMVAAYEGIAEQICLEAGGVDQGEKPARHWFEHRYAISYNQSKILSADRMVLDTIEVAAPWSGLLKLYKTMSNAISKHLTCMAHISHAYPDGASIYFTIIGLADEGKDIKLYDKVWDSALKACLRAGGVISHHHGVGLLKARFYEQQAPESVRLVRELKARLDPNNVLNPGKLGLS
ncbi:MAG: FAD-binding oxidoreductase [Candidatus Alcyoniella australis]|nr:FAD-binding oxidoreductase [Candidatus Alcyoniella australis]